MIKFDYATARVKDLQPEVVKKGERKVVDRITVDGRVMRPTTRFWTSFFAKFGFGSSTFKWFDHAEVFQRISDRAPSDTLRLCIESQTDGDQIKGEGVGDRLLAISNPASVLVRHEDLLGLLGDNGLDTRNVDYGIKFPRSGGSIDPRGIRIGQVGGDQHDEDGALMLVPAVPTISYDTGIVRSVHAPRNVGDFDIAGDSFSNRFVMDTPIDGYGKPSIYLMLLRQICSNGSIGYSRMFRSDLSLGKGEDSFEYALTRAFEGYNNEEGFSALRQRYEAAANSWASIQEINKTYKTLIRMHHRGEVRVDKRFLTTEVSSFKDEHGQQVSIAEGSPLVKSFHALVGDLTKAYGLANLDALSAKRQRTLPAGCTVYELLNYVTEVASHHSTPAGARTMQAVTGDFLSAEYDLEGTKDTYGDWKDFLITDSAASEAFAIARRS